MNLFDSRHDLPALSEALADALAEWLPTQRWFAGKGRPVLSVRPLRSTVLVSGDPLLLHLIVTVDQGVRPLDRYQLLIGARTELSEHLAHCWITTRHGLACYDAVHDPALTSKLLELLQEGIERDGLRFALEEHVTDLDTGLRSRPVTAEQSNTSLVFGQRYILKLFRRLNVGRNPDLELHRALHRVGCRHVAEVLGSVHTDLDGTPMTLAMLQQFLPDAVDGWAMATASVRDLMAEADLHADEVGGDFAAEAHRLGQAVAEVHADLSRALGYRVAGQEQVDAAVDAMQRRLDSVLRLVPELADHEAALRAAFERARQTPGPVHVQYIHGDLHLGQVLRSVSGWVLIDFEGEPAGSAADRTALRSPLRDVAGMLRSFDYAAHQLLIGRPDDHQLGVRALEWADRNRTAFCAGYAETSAFGDPRRQESLLRALELDKAVYEVAYEYSNRPEWLPVPLASIARITREEGA
ncbi:MAG TPA: aminoglycoside phosphotransferase [Pseudonocardiaceae bacterium]